MVASLFSGVNVIWMSVREAIHEPLDSIPRVPSKVRVLPVLGRACSDRFGDAGNMTRN